MKCIKLIVLIMIFTSAAAAQPLPQYYQLDPKSYDPAVDVNTDLFVNHWEDSPPVRLHGDLIVNDIFSPLKGDTLKPAVKGAVLTLLRRVSRFSMIPGVSSSPIRPSGEQEIYFVTGGTGELQSGGTTYSLYPEIGILIPAGVTATIKNTGQADLVGYLWVEPIPSGFVPKKQVTVRDTNSLPIEGPPGHWANYHRAIIGPEDGLAVLLDVHQTILLPMSISQAHASRPVGTDVIWVALEGEIYTLLGKKLYHLKPGSAFKNPSDSKVYHGSLNTSKFNNIRLIWARTIPPEDFK